MSLLADVVEAGIREALKSFAHHRLTLEADTACKSGGALSVYRVAQPDTTAYSFTVARVAGRLVLTGDAACPSEGNGYVSASGYGIDWFAGDLSLDYLCEKFLRKDFQPDYALSWLDDAVADAAGELQAYQDEHDEDDDDYEADENELDMRVQLLEEARDHLRGYDPDFSAADFHAVVTAADKELLGDGLPIAYTTADAINLATLQRVFARLYAEWAKRSDQTSLYASGTSVPKEAPK